MGVAAGSDEANDGIVFPDGLVRPYIGIVGVHDKSAEGARRGRVAFGHGRVTADEIVLGEMDESIETGFRRRVVRAVFP